MEIKFKKITIEQALEVARADTNNGISCAMALLKSYGFDTTVYNSIYYYEILDNDIDYENANIRARNLQYTCLGISKIMEQAYIMLDLEKNEGCDR